MVKRKSIPARRVGADTRIFDDLDNQAPPIKRARAAFFAEVPPGAEECNVDVQSLLRSSSSEPIDREIDSIQLLRLDIVCSQNVADLLFHTTAHRRSTMLLVVDNVLNLYAKSSDKLLSALAACQRSCDIFLSLSQSNGLVTAVVSTSPTATRELFLRHALDPLPMGARSKSIQRVFEATIPPLLSTALSPAAFYEHFRREAPPIDGFSPHPDLIPPLRSYQRAAVQWMLARETGDLRSRPPFDDPLFLRLEDAAGAVFFLNAVNFALRSSPPKVADVCRGGILADEMGLGKTIEVLHVALTNRHPPPESPPCDLPDVQATLIVCPPAIVAQWKAEIVARVVNGRSRVVVYVPGKSPLTLDAIQKAEFVVTTYDALRVDRFRMADARGSLRFEKRYVVERTPLMEVRWRRVCLDESQLVRPPPPLSHPQVDKVDKPAAEVALSLRSHFRWAVTGTPAPRSPLDVHGLLAFVGAAPFNEKYFFFKRFLSFLHEPTAPSVLKSFAWRTFKADVVDELDIPAQSQVTHLVDFSKVEREFYASQFEKCVATVREEHLEPEALMSKVMGPFLRLRQACCHPQVPTPPPKPSSPLPHPQLTQSAPNAGVMSMAAVLDRLIASAVAEGNDALRLKLTAMNGHAAVLVLKRSDIPAAAALYRAVLEEAVSVSTFTVDVTVAIHAAHNLAALAEEEPSLVTDDVTALKTLEGDFVRRFLSPCEGRVAARARELLGAASRVDEALLALAGGEPLAPRAPEEQGIKGPSDADGDGGSVGGLFDSAALPLSKVSDARAEVLMAGADNGWWAALLTGPADGGMEELLHRVGAALESAQGTRLNRAASALRVGLRSGAALKAAILGEIKKISSRRRHAHAELTRLCLPPSE